MRTIVGKLSFFQKVETLQKCKGPLLVNVRHMSHVPNMSPNDQRNTSSIENSVKEASKEISKEIPKELPKEDGDLSGDLKKKLYDTAEYAYGSLNDSRMMKDLKDLYVEMENRKYNTRWIVLSVAGLVCYVFYGKITDWASDQAADVTSKYLENPKFKRDLLVFVEQTIDDLVKSDRVQNDVTRLLKETVVKLSDDQEVQTRLENLFVRIFKSKVIKEAGSELSEDVLNQLLHSEKYENIRKEAMTFVVDELKNIVENKDLQQSVGMASWNAFKVWFGVAASNSQPQIQSQNGENVISTTKN